MSVFITLLAALFVFSAVIAIHEFGHFAVAKLCGIRVNEFSIGTQIGDKLGKHKMDSHRIQTLPCQNRHFLFSSGAQAKKSSISSAEFTILKGWAFFSSSSVPYP